MAATSRKFLLIATLLIAAPMAFADDGGYGPPVGKTKDAGKTAKVTGRAKLVIDNPEYKWGSVLQGDPVSHVYKVRNEGDEMLRINQVKPGCGCTSKRFDREIAPGETGEIELVLNTQKQRGKNVRKYATVFTNDPTAARAKVFLSGEVTELVKSTPTNLRLTGLAGTALAGKATLSAGSDVGIKIESVTSKLNKVSIVNLTEVNGEYIVEVSADPSARPMVIRDTLMVSVRTDKGEVRESQIPVIIDHKDRINVSPRGNLVFQKRQTERLLRPGAKPVSRDIQLSAGSDDITFNVVNVELLNLPEDAQNVFSVETTTLKPGSRYRIRVSLNEYRHDTRTLRGVLRITTDEADKPTRDIRLYAQFGAPTAGNVRPPAVNRSGGAKKVDTVKHSNN